MNQIDFSEVSAFYKAFGFDSNIELLVYPNRDDKGWAWSNSICLRVAVKCREQFRGTHPSKSERNASTGKIDGFTRVSKRDSFAQPIFFFSLARDFKRNGDIGLW